MSMKQFIKNIRHFLGILCIYLLSFGYAHAQVCDNFGVDSTDSFFIPAPITKFCVLAGSDPPEDWVPELGLGRGLKNTQSGNQVITNKASSLCPAPRIQPDNDDIKQGCGNYQFPNCMGSPDEPNEENNPNARHSGACRTGDDAVFDATLESEYPPDETYEEITADDIKCAAQLDIAAHYYPSRPQSACYGGDAKYCANLGTKGTCDTMDETDLEWTPYPHDYVEPEETGYGFVQLNDIEYINVGSAFMPNFDDCSGPDDCMNMFNNMSESDQELMIDSMFFMTGNFKTTAETRLELNNDYYRSRRECYRDSALGCLDHANRITKCQPSTLVIPANTYFKVTNISGIDIKDKYIIFWNQGVVGHQHNFDGDDINFRNFGNIYIGRLPPKTALMVEDRPLLMSGNLASYEGYVNASLVTDPDDILEPQSLTYAEFMADPYQYTAGEPCPYDGWLSEILCGIWEEDNPPVLQEIEDLEPWRYCETRWEGEWL